MAEESKTHKNKNDPENISSYIGLSFGLFLALLPKNAMSLLKKQQTQIKELSLHLLQSEEQLKQMKSRRIEDSKANARVVEIFATHRNAWQAEEKRLLNQIDEISEEMNCLRVKIQDLENEKEELKIRIQDLEKEVSDRDEMIGFISRNVVNNNFEVGDEILSSTCENRECYGGDEENGNSFVYNEQQSINGVSGGFRSEFLPSASKFWPDKASLWQDVHYEPFENLYHMKHFVPRRESPWKVDGESSRISSKLKLLEQELLNLENVDKTDPSKVPSLLRKQTKRYQTLAGKIDDLCRRMQASDPCEPTLSPEFRTQRQTEFLLEGFRLQQRATETGSKLMALQTEIGKSYYGDELNSQAKLTRRRSFDSIRNNLKEAQRNLEIWLARIIGDLEGILSRMVPQGQGNIMSQDILMFNRNL